MLFLILAATLLRYFSYLWQSLSLPLFFAFSLQTIVSSFNQFTDFRASQRTMDSSNLLLIRGACLSTIFFTIDSKFSMTHQCYLPYALSLRGIFKIIDELLLIIMFEISTSGQARLKLQTVHFAYCSHCMMVTQAGFYYDCYWKTLGAVREDNVDLRVFCYLRGVVYILNKSLT